MKMIFPQTRNSIESRSARIETRGKVADRIANHRRQVLFILPGPKYELADTFSTKLKGLSDRMEGYTVTSSPTPQVLHFGRFVLKAIRFPGRRSIFLQVQLLVLSTMLSLRAMRRGRRIELVVTSDPLVTGLIGYVVSRIFGARFATEVNGEYTCLENYRSTKTGRVRYLKRRLYLSVQRFVLGRAHGVKLLYPGQVDYFMPLPASTVFAVFANFVDLRPFRSLGEEKIVLVAGFPFRVKGVDVVVNAFQRIGAQHPEWRLKILGHYPPWTELQAHIAGCGQIFHHPAVSHEKMPQHIGTCSILVLPSRTEAMGRVLLEGMAAGKPRIGSNVGGIPTVITDGVDGLLFESEDEQRLAELLDRLMSSATLRKALGDAGAERARTAHSLEGYVRSTTEFYERVISQRTEG